MEIVDIRLWRYRTRLKAPVLTRPGLVLRERDSLLLELVTDDGRVGWGEAAPLPGFSRESLGDVTRAAISLREDVLRNRPRLDTVGLSALGGKNISDSLPSLQFAVETALGALDAGPAPRQRIPTAALLQGDYAEMPERAEVLAHRGYRALKLKVGRMDVDGDAGVLRSIRERVGPDVELRIDANRSWSWSQAIRFAEATDDLEISYVEEPLYDADRLGALRRETGLPVALDETLANAPLGREPHIPDFVDVLVLKPTLLGRRVQALIDASKTSGARVVMSACYETGVGTAAVARRALESAEITPAGIGTIAWLESDCLAAAVDFMVPDLDAVRLSGRVIRPDTGRLQPVVVP